MSEPMSELTNAETNAEHTGIHRIPSEAGIAVLRNMRNFTRGLDADIVREILYVVGDSGAFFSPNRQEKHSYLELWEKGARSLMDPENIEDTDRALTTLGVFKNIICAAAREDGVERPLRAHIDTVTARLTEGLTDANRSERIEEVFGHVPKAEKRGPERFINPETGGRGRGGKRSLVLRARPTPDEAAPAAGDDR